MTANLQPALHRVHLTLNECDPRAVVLDCYGIAWQKLGRRWYGTGYPGRYEDSLGEYELAQRGPIKVIYEGEKP